MQFHSRFGTIYLVIGALLAGMGLLTIATTGGFQIGTGLLMMVIGGWYKATPIAQFHDDHFEMRIAPLRATQRIRYTDIVEVTTPNPNQALLAVKSSDSRSPIKVPLGLFASEDRTRVLDELRSRTRTSRAA